MNILIIPVVLCAAYLVMVSVCVCERMTAETNHFIRSLVVLIGGIGAWALCKAVINGWGSTPEDLLQGVMIVLMAVVLGAYPRLKTGRQSERQQASQRRY